MERPAIAFLEVHQSTHADKGSAVSWETVRIVGITEVSSEPGSRTGLGVAKLRQREVLPVIRPELDFWPDERLGDLASIHTERQEALTEE